MQLVDEGAERALLLLALPGDELAALLPGREHGEEDQGDRDRQPGAVRELGQVRGEEQEVDRQQEGRPGCRIQSGVLQCRRAT